MVRHTYIILNNHCKFCEKPFAVHFVSDSDYEVWRDKVRKLDHCQNCEIKSVIKDYKIFELKNDRKARMGLK
jgi:hypothetical protein